MNVRHTDDTMDAEWSEASALAAEWFDEPDALVIEGVAVPRALRKWLAAHPEGKPCDKIIVLNQPFEDLTKGQISMAKGVATVFTQIYPELLKRGVVVGDKSLLG